MYYSVSPPLYPYRFSILLAYVEPESDTAMIALRFDVNDAARRRGFLRRTLMEAIHGLTQEARPLWGKMSPQHMVEHLVWSFGFSAGACEGRREIPAALAERTKRFLYDNRQTPRLFNNPLLGDEPEPLRLASLVDAKRALQTELDRFFAQDTSQPAAIRHHPIFGPLNAEEWERSHYKHCIHHLMQFGLVSVTDP